MSQYKISKKRLAEIIKEEYQSLQHRKTRRLNESDVMAKVWEMSDAILEVMEPQKAFENLVQALGRDLAEDHLGFIIQQYEIPFGDDEVEDYDPSAYNRKDEGLKGGQKKLDKDKDGDIDAKDMAALRSKKKVKKESLNSIRQLIQQELKNL
jgi:hypothetical protein